jgi:hypothetical protein
VLGGVLDIPLRQERSDGLFLLLEQKPLDIGIAGE